MIIDCHAHVCAAPELYQWEVGADVGAVNGR